MPKLDHAMRRANAHARPLRNASLTLVSQTAVSSPTPSGDATTGTPAALQRNHAMNATQLQPIQVLIADDHNLILEIVALALEDAADIVLTTAHSVAEVDQLLESHGPFTLILLDLDMPGMSGTQTVIEVMSRNAGQPVGVFTGAPTEQVIQELRRLGGAGIIPKSCSMRSLTDAIRIMATGEAYYDLVAPPDDSHLPPSRYAH